MRKKPLLTISRENDAFVVRSRTGISVPVSVSVSVSVGVCVGVGEAGGICSCARAPEIEGIERVMETRAQRSHLMSHRLGFKCAAAAAAAMN